MLFSFEGGGKVLKLYVIRHAETEWNAQQRMQGWKDSPLTEKEKNRQHFYTIGFVQFRLLLRIVVQVIVRKKQHKLF